MGSSTKGPRIWGGMGAIIVGAALGCGSTGPRHDAGNDGAALAPDTESGADSREREADDADAPVGDSVTRDSAANAEDRPTHTDGATTEGRLGSLCWEDGDCHSGASGFLLCQAPGESFGCPVCYTPTTVCTTDEQCSAGDALAICEPAACTCHGEKQCTAGCTRDEQCAQGFACSSAHRCAAKTCSASVVCPTDFACDSGARCMRNACTRDDECSVACVKGRCYDRPGLCVTPPA